MPQTLRHLPPGRRLHNAPGRHLRRSDRRRPNSRGRLHMSVIEVAVLTSSDRCSKGQAEDVSGKLVSEMIKTIAGRTAAYYIVPDEIPAITEKLLHYCEKLKVNLVITTG